MKNTHTGSIRFFSITKISLSLSCVKVTIIQDSTDVPIYPYQCSMFQYLPIEHLLKKQILGTLAMQVQCSNLNVFELTLFHPISGNKETRRYWWRGRWCKCPPWMYILLLFTCMFISQTLTNFLMQNVDHRMSRTLGQMRRMLM